MTDQKPIRRGVGPQAFGGNAAPIPDILTADYGDVVRDVEKMIEEIKAFPGAVKTDDDLTKFGRKIADARGLSKRIEEFRTDESGPLYRAQTEVNVWFRDLDRKLSIAMQALQTSADAYARQKAAEEKARLQREADEAARKAAEERAKAEEARTVGAAARAEGKADALDAQAELLKAKATGAPGAMVKTRGDGVTVSAKASWKHRIMDEATLRAALGPLGPFLTMDAIEAAIRMVVKIQKGTTKLPGVEVYQDTAATFRAR